MAPEGHGSFGRSQGRQQLGPGGRICQQLPEDFLIRQGVEEGLVLQGRGKEGPALGLAEDSGGVAAQELLGFQGLHGFPFPAAAFQLPPRVSSSCWRQRWSQV